MSDFDFCSFYSVSEFQVSSRNLVSVESKWPRVKMPLFSLFHRVSHPGCEEPLSRVGGSLSGCWEVWSESFTSSKIYVSAVYNFFIYNTVMNSNDSKT